MPKINNMTYTHYQKLQSNPPYIIRSVPCHNPKKETKVVAKVVANMIATITKKSITIYNV